MQGGTVIYDGNCGFCRRQVQRIGRLDTHRAFAFLPAQAPDLQLRFPQLAEANLTSGMRLIEPDGSVLVGADAIHAIARELPRYRYLTWLYRLPGIHQLARAAYGWIAANRHRFSAPCEDGTCTPPASPPEPDSAAPHS